MFWQGGGAPPWTPSPPPLDPSPLARGGGDDCAFWLPGGGDYWGGGMDVLGTPALEKQWSQLWYEGHHQLLGTQQKKTA